MSILFDFNTLTALSAMVKVLVLIFTVIQIDLKALYFQGEGSSILFSTWGLSHCINLNHVPVKYF